MLDGLCTNLRENELDADFNSRRKTLIPYVQNLPLLKTAAESYTKRMYSEFEEEFKLQHAFSCKLLQTEGSVFTYMVTHMHSVNGATVVFNTVDMTITCSCRKYESIGILCKHAFKVFNVNDVFILPSQYILNRWTKYAKRGFYIEKQESEKENLKAHAARISRKATSVALKCSVSKELLVELEKAIDKLDLEADNSLSERQEKSEETPVVSTNCDMDTLKGAISFRVPQVVKGAKEKRIPNVVEKNTGKKKKGAKKKGKDPSDGAENRDVADPNEMIQAGYANATMPDFHMYGGSSTMNDPYILGGYTSLLLGVDQAATHESSARKLHFSGVPNHENK